MILTVESDDMIWAWAAAYFCAEFRGKRHFNYGDVFTKEAPLVNDTTMDILLIFAQSILKPEAQSVQLNDYKVHFSQFYPIHRAELDAYRKIGLEKFRKYDGFNMYDPKRPPIQE